VSEPQRDALDQLLRDAPLDLGGEIGEQRVIFEEMMASIPFRPMCRPRLGASAGSRS
jgi:monoterpene epsilon-lactone hydrolase